MSQTSAFAKANNPDYVYLDLQQTNVYNNSTNADVDINFIVTRDAPVIANTGDYTVSVTRFQLDTYKLPTLVVEPDLTGTFNPERTIHKVALINTSAQFPLEPPTVTINQGQGIASGFGSELFGGRIDASSDGEYIVVGAPFANYGGAIGRGKVYLFQRIQSTGLYLLQDVLNDLFDNTTNLLVGQSVAISEDGNYIIVGTGDIEPSHTYLIERRSLLKFKIPKPALGFSSSYVSINHDGTIMAISYPTASAAYPSGNDRGVIQIRKVLGPGVPTVVQTINGLVDNKFLGYNVTMNASGSRIIIGSYSESLSGGVVRVYKNDTPLTSNVWTSESITIPAGIPDYVFGISTCVSHDGLVIAVGTTSATNTGNVLIYKYNVATSLYVYFQALTIPAGSVSYFGAIIGLSYDGTEIVLGYPESNSNAGRLVTYVEYGGTFIEVGITNGTLANGKLGNSVALWNDGNDFVAGLPGTDIALVYQLSYNFYIPMPSNISEHITVENVMWAPNPSYIAPTRDLLNGKNTVLQPYYYCNSYARFIGQVNDALGEAYITNFNYIYNNWVMNLTTTQKNIFYNIVARFYSTPPFLEWSNDSLKASLVANALFNSERASYAINERDWVVNGSLAENHPFPPIPFHFKIAFNASLYSLFNSFPATETIINNELFYIMDFTHPVPNIVNANLNAIPLYPTYPFLDPFIGADGIITLDSPLEYGHIGTHIVLDQELSTIDTWCPVNGIVFTTNTLPIVINQFSANSTINGERPNPEAGADFALVLTDLQTNQQGYKPNVLYTPSAEYRRIDMTGNLGLTNIDIRVFWRAKTGQLIPMRLNCGATASLKLLFQKKLLGERQQLQFNSLSVKDLKI